MPLVAVEALDLDVPTIVLAAQASTFIVNMVGTVARLKVLWSDVVWVVLGADRVTERSLLEQVGHFVVGVVHGDVVSCHE